MVVGFKAYPQFRLKVIVCCCIDLYKGLAQHSRLKTLQSLNYNQNEPKMYNNVFSP